MSEEKNRQQTRTGLVLCALLLLAGIAVFGKTGLALVGMDFAVANSGSDSGSGADEDVPAPLFSLEAMAGAPVALEELRGQVVLINFWATWCGPCKLEMPHIQALHEQYGDQGLTVLAISTDQYRDKVEPFIKNQGFTFPVLYDDGSAQANYRVRGIPSLFLLDQAGIIRYSQAGYSPAVVPRLEKMVAQLLAATPSQDL
ncbi:MAG: redoxin domain-containing protein [Candidatus Latescibacteria bacterium]|nr:redoxin domain-containing protein [Candidatus Latescibacterota bacterium]